MEPRTKYILDAPVPQIGVPSLIPVPYKTGVRRLKDNAVKEAKLKWNKFYDWLINHVPAPKRIDPNSTIHKLKNHIMKLYRESPNFQAEERKRAARGYFKTFTLPGNDYKDPKLYLSDAQNTITRLIENNLSQGLKIRLSLKCEMSKVSPNADSEDITETPYFNSNLKVILRKDTISEEYREMIGEILEKIANFNRRGSGWQFRQVIRAEIHLNKYEPLSGSSYIPLAKILRSKKAIINVQNKDNEYFKWSVVSALFPVQKNSTRVT